MYSHIADWGLSQGRPDVQQSEPQPVGLPQTVSPGAARLSDAAPINWRFRLGLTQLPLGFLHEVGDFVLTQDSEAESIFRVSFLELLFVLRHSGVAFPVWSCTSGRWLMPSEVTFEDTALTVAAQLRVLRKAFRQVLQAFNASAWWVGSLQILDLQVSLRLDGIEMGCDSGLLRTARSHLQDFTGGRPIRASRDLARAI